VASALDSSVSWLVGTAARLVQRRLSSRLSAFGLTPPQWGVLITLFEVDGLSPTDLAARTAIDGPTMTGVLDRLEQAGFVYRQRDPRDRRMLGVYLTESGRALHDALPRVIWEANEEALDGLSDQQVAALFAMLRQVIANLG